MRIVLGSSVVAGRAVRETALAAEGLALCSGGCFLYLVGVTPHQRKIRSIVSKLPEWYARHARDLPWRRTRDPYGIWVSEIMLQQTQVKTVMAYWERWMGALPDIQSLARADSGHIHKLWEGLGYYTRVRNLQQAARQIVEQHGGVFPGRFEDVLRLPGIGRYTAGAICSIAFGQPKPVLDGNVVRVLTRIFGIGEDARDAATRARLWSRAEELVDGAPQAPGDLNQALMELGATVCLPSGPECSRCPVRACCVACNENRVAALPNLGKRARSTPRRFLALVIARNGKYLVRQRPPGVVNARLWEFPNVEAPPGMHDPAAWARGFIKGLEPGLEPCLTVRHAITRYRITLVVYRARLASRARPAGLWATPADLRALAFSSAHRKIVNSLG